MGGAATGGAAVGITAGVAGLGGAAMESAALTMGQYVGIGAGSGAVGGAASSLATDAGRKFADGENVTWKQVLGHAVLGAAVGAAAGATGGAVTKSVVGIEASAATANLEGENWGTGCYTHWSKTSWQNSRPKNSSRVNRKRNGGGHGFCHSVY